MSARKRESVTRLTGSRQAKQRTAVILEVFAGIRGAQEAGEALGLSANRYYQQEARAVQAIIDALEPKPRGRQRGPEEELAKLRVEKERLEREVGRLTSLVRASRRSLGISGPAKSRKTGKPSRKRGHRGRKVIAMLARPAEDGGGEAKAS
jgi:hypothetical protein